MKNHQLLNLAYYRKQLYSYCLLYTGGRGSGFRSGAHLCAVQFHSFFPLVDGNWEQWSKWSECTKTCKQGTQARKRECNSPAAQYGGKKCPGKSMQTQDCNKNVPCPGEVVQKFIPLPLDNSSFFPCKIKVKRPKEFGQN